MVERTRDVPLSSLSTIGVGGPATELAECQTADDLISVCQEADSDSHPLLLIGGGSNLLIDDSGWPGIAAHVGSTGVQWDGDLVTAAAGENWDDFVAQTVAAGRPGLAALSGIPGSVGATPIQNVGAYGQDVSQTIVHIAAWDRQERGQVQLTNQDLEFGYRNSLLKRNPDRYLVLDVTFQLPHTDVSPAVSYPELAKRLGLPVGGVAPAPDVRAAVLQIRRSKGMVLDPDDTDSRSLGSFFTNPVVDSEVAAGLPSTAPRYASPRGVKLSAAWLIENSGISKGMRVGGAAISGKHVLAITNVGHATFADVRALAHKVQQAVLTEFGIQLVPEPRIVGTW